MIAAIIVVLVVWLIVITCLWVNAAKARDTIRVQLKNEAWACCVLAEGLSGCDSNAVINASNATRAVHRLSLKCDGFNREATDLAWKLADATTEKNNALADANRLAECVRAYLKQMDEYSMKLGEEPCKLSREREALSVHQKLIEPEPCPTVQNSAPSSTAASLPSTSTPTPQ